MFHFRLTLFAAASLAAASLTGCSNMVATAITDTQSHSSAPLTGNVHGGQQPIVQSTVTLWAAGNTGYGSTATQLAQTTSDSNGNFSFVGTYTCPAANSSTASPLLYITASGGQPTALMTNSQAALMVALGDCLTVNITNPTANINELSTVAMTALQQFFKPDTTNGLGSIGTSATNVLGLSNAMKTINNFINVPYGTSFASTTISGAVNGYTSAPVATVTPEQGKLNTMADILAACINTNGS